MVLRLILLFSVLLSQSAFAQKKNPRTIYLKVAQKLYLKKQYQKSVSTLKRYYRISSPSDLPTPVVQLLALDFLKLKKYKVSAQYFHLIIKRRYNKKHREVLRSLDNGSLDEMEIPQKLLRIYYHLGQIYYTIFNRTQSIPYYRASEKYFKICETKEHLDDNSMEYREALAAIKSDIDKKEFKREWFLSAGIINWQEKLELQSATTGNTTKLLSNAKAMCIGGGFRYSNAYHGMEISSCAFSGSAKISSTNPSVTYSQEGIAVTGLLLDTGYIFKPYSEKTSLTFSLPLFYRDGDYTQPDNFTILGKGQLSAGFMLKARYELPFIDFTTSFGTLGWTNLFMMQAGYTF